MRARFPAWRLGGGGDAAACNAFAMGMVVRACPPAWHLGGGGAAACNACTMEMGVRACSPAWRLGGGGAGAAACNACAMDVDVLVRPHGAQVTAAPTHACMRTDYACTAACLWLRVRRCQATQGGSWFFMVNNRWVSWRGLQLCLRPAPCASVRQGQLPSRHVSAWARRYSGMAQQHDS